MSRYDISEYFPKMLELMEREPNAVSVCMKMLEIWERVSDVTPDLDPSENTDSGLTMDPATLVAVAIGEVLQYLVALGNPVTNAPSPTMGVMVWKWMKGKLTSDAGKAALVDLEMTPEDGDNRKATEAALSKLLKSDCLAHAELSKLIEYRAASSVLVVTGSQNTIGQVVGSGSISITQGEIP